MLNKLRAEALAVIAATSHCTLSTSGPAGVQASVVECLVHEDCVYVLVPATVDHLFNLEYELEIVLTSPLWQLRGAALDLSASGELHGTAPGTIAAQANQAGFALIEVFPLRMDLEPNGRRRYRETIDFCARVSNTSRRPVASIR